jgi:hypothetical protein
VLKLPLVVMQHRQRTNNAECLCMCPFRSHRLITHMATCDCVLCVLVVLLDTQQPAGLTVVSVLGPACFFKKGWGLGFRV